MSMPDFYNLIAKERGMPDNWQWIEVRGIGRDRENGAFLLKGGVPSVMFKSGPRKGTPNWAKAEHQSEFVITFRELDAFMVQWELKTGICNRCGGSGKCPHGWNAAEGTRTKDCDRCTGTGKPLTVGAPTVEQFVAACDSLGLEPTEPSP